MHNFFINWMTLLVNNYKVHTQNFRERKFYINILPTSIQPSVTNMISHVSFSPSTKSQILPQIIQRSLKDHNASKDQGLAGEGLDFRESPSPIESESRSVEVTRSRWWITGTTGVQTASVKPSLIASTIPRLSKDKHRPEMADSSICARYQIQRQENWLNPLTSVAVPRKNGVLWLTLNPTETREDSALGPENYASRCPSE